MKHTPRNPILRFSLPLLALTMAGTSHAATILYAGFQATVESKTNDPTNGWRNSSPTKPLDIDGDNILGTDGYHTFGNGAAGTAISLPSYIGSVTRLAPSQNASTGWGVIDDPSDPSGTDDLATSMWFANPNAAYQDIAQFTISGTDLNGQTLRLGVFLGGYTAYSSNLVLTQTAGGTASVSSGTVSGPGGTSTAGSLDVAFFDLTNVSAGDTFVLSSGAGTGYRHASGFTFDTVAVPEPSAALLGSLGLLLLLRRRRC